MKDVYYFNTKKLSLPAWEILSLIISIPACLVILTNQFPNLFRSLSITFRTSFGVIIAITCVVMYLVYCIPGRTGQFLGMAATLLLFCFPLAGVWASGHTQSILINGLLPYSDARDYYSDALRIMHGINISNFSAMRPFSSGFLSVLLTITNNNLMSALGIITILAGLSAYLAAREVQNTHGAEPAVFFLMAMFLYYRHHVGTTLSEPFGIIASLLGIGLIWRGTGLGDERITYFGIGMSTFALNIRPGAMFVLPLLLLWGGFQFRKENKFSFRFLLIGAATVTLFFILNSIEIKFLAGPDGQAFANFSWALYGLASGGNSWTYVFQSHPEVFQLPTSEQNIAIYKLVFGLIIHDPSLIVSGAIKYWGFFFSNTWYNAFAFLAGNNYWVNEMARWSAYILCILGICYWLKKPKDGFTLLVIFGSLGILVSVPFVPPTDAYRVRLYAATIPFFGLLPAMGIAFLRDKMNFHFMPQSGFGGFKVHMGYPISLLIILITVFIPVIIKSSNTPPIAREDLECSPGMKEVIIEFHPGTFLNITRENMVYVEWMPNFHISSFKRNVHNLADNQLINYLSSIKPPSTLLYSLDLQSWTEVLVVIDSSTLPPPGGKIVLCGHFNDNPNFQRFNIFEADYVTIE